MRNLVCHIKRRIWIEGLWEQVAEDNIWTYERGSKTGDWRKLHNKELYTVYYS
jgi:hypothetical protein